MRLHTHRPIVVIFGQLNDRDETHGHAYWSQVHRPLLLEQAQGTKVTGKVRGSYNNTNAPHLVVSLKFHTRLLGGLSLVHQQGAVAEVSKSSLSIPQAGLLAPSSL